MFCRFSLGTPVSSTNKTDRHDITEILLNVALNTITQTLIVFILAIAFSVLLRFRVSGYPFDIFKLLFSFKI
jgi:hypothetical protein